MAVPLFLSLGQVKAMTRKSATVAVCLLLAIALLGAATIGVLYRRQQSLPVYVVGELPPAGGYATNTLTLGDVTYVSGKAEFRLLPLHESFWPVWAIGRTSRGPGRSTGLMASRARTTSTPLGR